MTEFYQLNQYNQDILKNSFQRNLVDNQDSVMNKLERHILTCAHDWKILRIYSPIVTVIQSSGHGKTKSFYEYSKKHITVYMNMKQNCEVGYPHCSKIDKMLYSILNCGDYEELKMFFKIYFLAALEEINKIKEKLSSSKVNDFNEHDIALQFTKTQSWSDNTSNFFAEFESKWQNRTQYSKVNIFKMMKETMMLNADELTLNLVIDDVHLIKTFYPTKYIENFRKLRNSLAFCFIDCNFVCIMISNDMWVNDYNMGDTEITTIIRTFNLKNYPPFSQLVYCDQVKPVDYLNKLNEIENDQVDRGLYQFILERKPLDSIFYFGRPIWGSYIESAKQLHLDNKKKDMVELAKFTLINASKWSDLSNESQISASLAILAVTTNLLNHVVIVKRQTVSELISRHMGTLFGIDQDCEVISFRYVSEPILAEAAAFYMSDNAILAKINIIGINIKIKILENLNNVLSETSVQSSGLMSELVAEIILLTAKNKALRDKLNVNGQPDDDEGIFSKAISVREFLKALTGKDFAEPISSDGHKHLKSKSKNKSGEKLSYKFLNGIVSFTHFIKKQDTLKKKGLLMHMVGRSAAVRFKDHFPVYDFLIPVILENNKIGALLIQVENKVEFLENPIYTMSKHMLFTDKDYDNMNLSTDLKFEEDDCMSILMKLGVESANESWNRHGSGVYEFNGLDQTVYPFLDQSIVEQLKLLLDFSRTNPKCSNNEITKNITQFNIEPSQL